MSQVSPTPSTSSSTFQSVLNVALERYENKTKNKLLTHPLAAQIQSCDNTAAIHAVLEGIVQRFDQRRRNDERLTKWLDPTVDVLYSFSCAVGNAGGLVNIQMTISQEIEP
jgi:mannitol-1-phosphate/altronate dehydrogenase